jgi:multiple sugar transport system permease protein
VGRVFVKKMKTALSLSFLAVMACVALLPVLFIFLNSLAGNDEIMHRYGALAGADTPLLLTFFPNINLWSYERVFLRTPNYLMKFWTSFFMAFAIVAGQLIFSAISGYGFAKFKFPFSQAIFFALVILMMMPIQVTIVPTYIMLDRIGLIGSYASVILPGAFSVFGVFLMRQTYLSIPDSITEAAEIDGCSEWTVFARIVAPNGKHGIGALAVLCFIDSWNMVEQPLLFLKDAYKYPLSVFLASINSTSIDTAFVCSVLTMFPPLCVYLFFKDYLVSGIQSANF